MKLNKYYKGHPVSKWEKSIINGDKLITVHYDLPNGETEITTEVEVDVPMNEFVKYYSECWE